MAQHDAEARVRRHIQRTSEAQAALATLKEQTELQSIERAEQEQHARDELERQSAEQAASFAARVFDAELRVADLTNQLASASSALAAEQQRSTETATAHAFELDSLRARLTKTDQRATDAQALVQQLTAKVREMIAAKQRDRDAEIAIEQASLLRDAARGQNHRGDDFALIAGGGPDVHQLYRVARAQLARTTEAAAKADERHEHALRALDKAHKQELAAAEETKQTLLSQLSSLRVAHGAELARVEASLARVHVRAAQAAALYASIRPQLGLTFLADVPSVSRNHGLLVTAVSAGLGAAKAGIRIGDVIEDIAGAQVRSAAEVTRALEQVRAGQQCMLYVRRVSPSEGETSANSSTTADSLPSDAGGVSGDAATRVEYLSFSVLTSSSQFTAHQLTVLRRVSPVDASGITSARNLDDEQLLDLMLSNAGFRAGVTVPPPPSLLTSGVRTVAGGAPQAHSRRRSLRQEEKEREETAQANTDAATSTHAEATAPQAVVQ
jgi:C-terminal processing protease CtpA/Prc